jgi:DNA ligase-associated metallophosphoesterase
MIFFPYNIANETLLLSPERAIFWEKEKALLLSDLHIGKTGHFRKAGIGIPEPAFKNDLHRLVHLLQFCKAEQLIIVGDLFHSRFNQEIAVFERWRKDFVSLTIHLVKGNHDILHPDWYSTNEIKIHPLYMSTHNLCFVHDPLETAALPENKYIISGHIHPGIRIEGLAKQSLRFPCFYFTETQAVLPAFGGFTGLHPIQPKKKDHVFAIVNKQIIQIHSKRK